MSSSHMDVVSNACRDLDVQDIMADGDFNLEESIFNLEMKEFGYVANMRYSTAIGKSVMFVRYRNGPALPRM